VSWEPRNLNATNNRSSLDDRHLGSPVSQPQSIHHHTSCKVLPRSLFHRKTKERRNDYCACIVHASEQVKTRTKSSHLRTCKHTKQITQRTPFPLRACLCPNFCDFVDISQRQTERRESAVARGESRRRTCRGGLPERARLFLHSGWVCKQESKQAQDERAARESERACERTERAR